jgi:hypothetical protein
VSFLKLPPPRPSPILGTLPHITPAWVSPKPKHAPRITSILLLSGLAAVCAPVCLRCLVARDTARYVGTSQGHHSAELILRQQQDLAEGLGSTLSSGVTEPVGQGPLGRPGIPDRILGGGKDRFLQGRERGINTHDQEIVRCDQWLVAGRAGGLGYRYWGSGQEKRASQPPRIL